MKAIAIEVTQYCSYVRNLVAGADVEAELAKAKADYPGSKCTIIEQQSFGANPAPVTGPERDAMPGF